MGSMCPTFCEPAARSQVTSVLKTNIGCTYAGWAVSWDSRIVCHGVFEHYSFQTFSKWFQLHSDLVFYQWSALKPFLPPGVRDRVKCFYCNGGLQNWRQNDDPWEEHAKWYPTCEFLLQQRGPEFVHSVVARFPNINRPPPLRRHLQNAPAPAQQWVNVNSMRSEA